MILCIINIVLEIVLEYCSKDRFAKLISSINPHNYSRVFFSNSTTHIIRKKNSCNCSFRISKKLVKI